METLSTATSPAAGTVQQLGDARSGKLADNITGFGRALRRAGLPLDGARMALALDALRLVGVERREDARAALEAVLVSREQDRAVFAEMFEAWFRNPELAQKLLQQMLPSSQGKLEPVARRPRVREALSPLRAAQAPPKPVEQALERDACMSASELQRLRHADFNALSASEYQLVQRLVCQMHLPLPRIRTRRTRVASAGAGLHWPAVMHQAARLDGEWLHLPRLQRREQALPLLVLLDVSGSMERYARLLLAFLHAAARPRGDAHGRVDVFAFGTHLTDLTPSFRPGDTDAMLAGASAAIDDFAGGTRLGESLRQLRRHHARRLLGRRTLVLLITDGLDTDEAELLATELGWLRRSCRKLLWLNPLLRFDGYLPSARGAAVLHQHAHAMLAVHNISKLEELARGLAQLVRR
jgi:uncharacterized protein with von Willebrand factor type A (vWA) domain